MTTDPRTEACGDWPAPCNHDEPHGKAPQETFPPSTDPKADAMARARAVEYARANMSDLSDEGVGALARGFHAGYLAAADVAPGEGVPSITLYAVGDPDPTTQGAQPTCDALSADGFWCTWERGHTHPQHVAGDETEVCAVWSAQGVSVEEACEVMHDAYEAAAVQEGWATQERSRKPWAEVPEANKATMRAAVGALLEHLGIRSSQG